MHRSMLHKKLEFKLTGKDGKLIPSSQLSKGTSLNIYIISHSAMLFIVPFCCFYVVTNFKPLSKLFYKDTGFSLPYIFFCFLFRPLWKQYLDQLHCHQ